MLQSKRPLTPPAFRTALLLGMTAFGVQAAPPLPFEAKYDASYGDVSAEAERSLVYDATTNKYTLYAEIDLELLGATLTSIDERSEFYWQDEQPLPLRYEFEQKGFGARSRSVEFDHAQGFADFTVNDDKGTLPLTGPVFDDLSGYLLLKEKLEQGETDIQFDVLDRGEIKVYHYMVLDEEMMRTSLGEFVSVHLERIRGEDSARRTELWLAPERDYLLLKLVQTEPNGRTIKLDIREALLNGEPLAAAVEPVSEAPLP
jgi:hypothetical protein